MNVFSFNKGIRLSVTLVIAACGAQAEGPYTQINRAAETATINTHTLRANVSMLEGSGGNIAVLSTPDGLFLVDTGIAVSEQKIAASLEALSPLGIRYAINTHWHWDHTDGNRWVRQSGARIMADKNAIARMKQTIRIEEWDHTFTPLSDEALPDFPITDDMILTFGGERVIVRRYTGHTDGDLSVYFETADVLVTGDTFWNGMYPFIDNVAGGGIDGAIRQAEANLAMAGPQTLIIPGHGPVARRADAEAYRDMLVLVRSRIAALKTEGKSLSDVQRARPTADLDAHWGASVISGQLFTELVYRGL